MGFMPSAKYLDSEWKLKTRRISQRLTEFYRVFRKRHYPVTDDLFFALEDLPYLGKEYWFLHFCAPPNEEQVVLTLGRSVEPVKVNNTHVESGGKKGSVPCAAVCWLYSKKKQVIFDSSANVSIENPVGKKGVRKLCAQKGSGKISVFGNYPKYSIELAKNGKRIFTARAFAPKHGIPFEMVHLMKTSFAPGFGAAMINYYFDFIGKLDGKRLSGKAYMQKVVAVLPLAPWNWVRLQFANGQVLDFFAAKPFGTKSDLHFAGNNYIEIKGKRRKIHGFSLSSYLSGDRAIWVLSGKNLYCAMETVAFQPFVMKQKTTFRYDEYLVKVRAFAFRDGKEEYGLSDFGGGVGIVENASGYLF